MPSRHLLSVAAATFLALPASAAETIWTDIVVRVFWVSSDFARMKNQDRAKFFGEIIPLVASGTMKAAVEATYPLTNIHDALAHALRGERDGKIRLTR